MEIATQSVRSIKVVPSVGQKQVILSDATTWKQLERLLSENGISTTNMKCVEGFRKSTLEHPDAVLPEGEFSLFLMPYKSKSGGAIREQVKALFQENREAAREHFGNYTQKKEDELEKLLKVYSNRPGKSTSKKKEVKLETSAGTYYPKGEVATEATSLDSYEAILDAVDRLPKERKENLVDFILETMGIKALFAKPEISQEEQDRIDRMELEEIRKYLPDVRTY